MEKKFRAWHTKQNEWWYFTLDELIDAGNKNEIQRHGQFLINRTSFAGLNDKNRKEIFEGDILNFWWPVNGPDGEEDFIPLVVVIDFHGGAFWFKGGGYTDCNWHFYNAENREIIGNIYENPELIPQLNKE